MDDLTIPSLESVPPVPIGSGGALPPSSAALPGQAPPSLSLPIGATTKVASRPARYEDGLDTRPLTPPSSSHNLQLVFDSSKIYDKHPRKYRLLLETDKDHTSHSGKSASPPSNVTTSPSVTVEDGRVVAMGTTGSGPVVNDPSPMPDAGAAVGPPKLGATPAPSTVAPFSLSEAASSVSVKKEQGQSRYVPQEFLQSFTAATKLSPPSDSKKPVGASSISGPPAPAKMPPSVGIPSTGIVHPKPPTIPQIHVPVPTRKEMPPGCLVVQPEPRRLFGFGPFYRPLPETLCDPGGRRQSCPTLTVPSGLSETITKEGITAAGHPGGRRSSAAVDSIDSGVAGVTTGAAAGVTRGAGAPKKPPTPAELNVWLGGSF